MVALVNDALKTSQTLTHDASIAALTEKAISMTKFESDTTRIMQVFAKHGLQPRDITYHDGRTEITLGDGADTSKLHAAAEELGVDDPRVSVAGSNLLVTLHRTLGLDVYLSKGADRLAKKINKVAHIAEADELAYGVRGFHCHTTSLRDSDPEFIIGLGYYAGKNNKKIFQVLPDCDYNYFAAGSEAELIAALRGFLDERNEKK